MKDQLAVTELSGIKPALRPHGLTQKQETPGAVTGAWLWGDSPRGTVSAPPPSPGSVLAGLGTRCGRALLAGQPRLPETGDAGLGCQQGGRWRCHYTQVGAAVNGGPQSVQSSEPPPHPSQHTRVLAWMTWLTSRGRGAAQELRSLNH